MKTYKYPYKVPFLELVKNSSKLSKNPIPFQKKKLDKSGEDAFIVKPLFSKPILITRSATIAREILQKKQKSFEKSKIQTKFLSKYIGFGLLTATGSHWLKQRRLIQPAFHKEKINQLLQLINQSIAEEVTKIKPNKYVDLYVLMNNLAFQVIANSLFNFSENKDTYKRLQFIIEKLQKQIVAEIRQPQKRLFFILNGTNKKSKKLAKESRVIIKTIIENRKKESKKYDDLLDMLLHATYQDGSVMEMEQLIDEILILFVAGHETTANALTFTLFLLANNPKQLKQVQQECINFSSKTLNMTTLLQQLAFSKQCIEESLRLYPPAWILDRVALQDETIGKYTLQKGTIIGISLYEMHRNKNYWNQPEQFIPNRFSEDSKRKTAPFYMPFGAGPRLCIGNNFAMLEMVLTLQNIFQKFNLETKKSTININPLITLKPVDVKAKFTKRANA